MKTLTTYIEQLDRAAEELHGVTDVGNRLALILVDNVIELILHRYCVTRFGWSGKTEFPDAPQRYNRASKARVLGNRFDEKVKFVRAEKKLSDIESNFINVCHKYRNEAYHVGLLRENVLLPVASLYHELACELFVRLDPKTRSHGAKLIIPPRVAKHAPPSWQTDHGWVDLFATSPIAASLNSARPQLPRPAAHFYADALDEWITHLVEVAHYTITGFGEPVPEVLRDAQWWKDLFSNIPTDIEDGEPFNLYLSEKQARMTESWKPRYDSLPFEGWRSRLARIRQNKDGRVALLAYDRLYDEVAYFSGFILDAAGIIDQQVEEAIERSKEERHRNR
ncbi:hypothetical protein SAMN05446935_0343 [Burkholderia sp. YR290]|nr:hypothetical protein SAMN05446935_0343 [Burkholderia sp. YR290]